MAVIDDLTLGDIMSREVVAAQSSCRLAEATQMMAAAKVSSLVVIDDGQVKGILTERDLVRLIHARTPPDTAVSAVMSSPVLSAPADLDFRSGYALLRKHCVRHLLIIDTSGAPVGIATSTDFRTQLGLDIFSRIDDLRSVQDPVASELAPNATLADALQHMMAAACDYVLVTERRQAIGIVTERDMSRLLSTTADPSTISIVDAMTAPVHCLTCGATVADAAAEMASRRVRHMPVIDDIGTVVGIVSQARLLEKIGFELLSDAQEDQRELRHDNARLQDRLNLALEASGLGIWEYDHLRDRITWSPALCRLLGYTEDQAPAGMDAWLQLIHPQDLDDLKRQIDAALGSGNPLYESEHRIRTGTGSWAWIHSRGRVIQRAADGRPLVTAGTSAEVTDRKLTEAVLQGQRMLWEALTRQPDRLSPWDAIVDSALQLPDIDCGAVYQLEAGAITLRAHRGLSPAFCDRHRDLGTSHPRLVSALRHGRPCCNPPLLDRSTSDELSCRLDLPEDGIGASVALPILCAGQPVAALYLASREASQFPPGTIGALESLLEAYSLALQRLQATDEARHQRQNVEGLFRAMTDYVFVTDLDGRIVHYNDAVATRLAPESGWGGVPVWEIHPEDCREEARRILTELVAGRCNSCSLPLVDRNGQRILVETRIVRGQWDGSPALLGVSRDVTELAGQRDAVSRSETLLRSTLDSTADGLLVIGDDGKPLLMNRRFQELWKIPDTLANTDEDDRLLRHVVDQLVAPDAFLEEVQRLYGNDEERTDNIDFKDGRVYERYTRTVRLAESRARLWSFRDMTERARARRAVEYERARLKTLIRTIPDLVWLKDPDGIYLACNPAFEALFGASESEIIGKTDYDFVDPEIADFFRARDLDAIASAGACINQEWLSFARSGYQGLFETVKTPMYDGDGGLVGVLGVARDISELKRIQAELEGEAIRRRILFEQSADGIVVLDEQGGVYESNARFADMIGYAPEEVQSLSVWDWDAQLTREELLERLANDAAVIFETRHRRKDGSTLDVEVSTNLAEWNGRRLRYCVCRDISDRKSAEAALVESEERFRATFDQAAEGIALIDAETLQFTQFNESAHRQLGYTREEFSRLDLGDVQAELTIDQIRERVAVILSTGKADFESRHRRKDGEIRDVRITNRVITLRGRKYFAAIWSDITERKRAEDALRDTAMFLKESQTIARVGGWKANPATGMLVWTEEVYRLVEHPLDQPPATLDEGLEYYAPEYLPEIRRLLLSAWEDGVPFTTECEMIARSGRRFWAELRCVGRVERDGQVFITGTFQDISERRRLEDEIRRREKYLRSVIDNFPFLVWLKDVNGRFLAVNAPFAAACNQSSPEDVVGKTDLDFWPRELAETYMADDRAVLADGQPRNIEEPFDDNGSRTWIETYKSPIVLDGVPLGTVGFARDISRRMETESRLRDSERALREAQTVAQMGSWTFDIPNDELRWSDETYRIFGVPTGTPLTFASFAACIHPEDSETVLAAWERALTESRFDIEHRIFTGGGVRWVRERAEVRMDDHGRAWFAIGTAQDITERREAEEQLRKLGLAVEQSPNSIVITDAKGRIEYVNEAFVEATGYTREEALGQNPRILKSGQTPDSTFAALWETLTQGETWQGEFVNRRRDGTPYDELARISPVRQPNGRITHYLAIKEDITARKQAAAELERYRHHLEELVAERTNELAGAKEAAEAASRAKSTFLANMSHEIRTPLNAIVGLTFLLQRKYADPYAQQQLTKVSDAARHLLNLISGILDISKIEAGKFKLECADFELGSLFEKLRDMLYDKAAAKGVELVFDVDPALSGVFRGDPMRLGQVLLNLVGNAEKFTERGFILVQARRERETDESVWLRFDVQDTGIGIQQEDVSRLFMAFEQADGSTTRKYGGTGLGLTISQRLVQLMEGEIGVNSIPGEGSTFWFTARVGKRGDSPVGLRPGLVRQLEGQRALVVDDLPAARAVISTLLADLGMRVETRTSANEALESIASARRQGDFFRIIAFDSQLPDLDVGELNECLQALEPAPACLILGAPPATLPRPDPGSAAWIVMAKPVTPAALYPVLTTIVEVRTPEQVAAVAAPSIESPKPGPRILLAEDNPINREVATSLLVDLGFRPDIARDGAEAVAKTKNLTYDLILMDVQMPVMDGLSATRAIRLLPGQGEVPIIAMTANAFDEDRARCLSAGMNGVLVKPVDPALLAETLAKWLRTPGAGQDQRPRDSGDDPDLLQRVADRCEIAANEGLKYTGGNVGRYLCSLRRFAETHADDMDRLGKLLDAAQGAEAVRLVHSLKGVSAMLGARLIQERATALEMALKAGLENPDIPGLTSTLRKDLGDCVAALLSVLPAESAAAPAAVGAAAARRQLQRLECYLAEDNVAATQFFRESEPQFRDSLGERTDLLRQMLDNFDYPVALELIRAILTESENSD